SRRTDLGTASYPGREAITVCADLMAKELGWDDVRRNEEIEKTIVAFPANIRERCCEPSVQ
ncbi:MAG: hypothetical protein GXP10_00725, partial [Gammaproteobacteria bacterium]|nr:hypothetical protein [Gammaproteobacteria bacterium]